jgi:large subunit ribosomal protein L3
VAIEFICRKIGMTQVFNDAGECIPVTVLDAQPNRVIQKKTPENDGYSALQLGYGERAQRHATKPLQGHCAKAGAPPVKVLKESRIPAEELEKYEVGQQIEVDVFSPGQRVDVIGTSKGKGFAGVVKRHGFSIKKRTHGTHEVFRHGGSIGPGSYPGRVIKGLRMAGQMGNARVTTLNIEVVRVDPEKRLLFVRGGVPGHNDALVRVRSSVRARS